MSLSLTVEHRFEAFTLSVDVTLPDGVTALLGPSGAGKTTLAQAVAGHLRPDQGRIALGEDVLFDSASGVFVPPHRRRIGYVFQEARLFPHMTAGQNIAFARLFNPRARALERGPILEMLGISHLMRRRPAGLSGGEKARVALARALLSAPRMLVLDEPLAALDQARKDEILPYLEGLRDVAKMPILYVTHSETEAARLATSILRLDQGRLVRQG